MGAVEQLEAKRSEFKALIKDEETPDGARYGFCQAHNSISGALKHITGEPQPVIDCTPYKPGP